MISVCMTTFNGEKFIFDQINSILMQLGVDDEIIIVDDKSTDKTIDCIKSLNIKNLKLVINDKNLGVVKNFEKCLSLAKGDIILLADQDDIWYSNKVTIILQYLKNGFDCVISNISLIDKDGNLIQKKVYNNKREGLVKNIISNKYLGCAMAFNRNILNLILPFPDSISMHDIWIGNVAAFYKKLLFIDIPLVYYRRHDSNVSPTLSKSNISLINKIKYRLYLIINLIKLFFKYN